MSRDLAATIIADIKLPKPKVVGCFDNATARYVFKKNGDRLMQEFHSQHISDNNRIIKS
jgi:hypothetical protein